MDPGGVNLSRNPNRLGFRRREYLDDERVAFQVLPARGNPLSEGRRDPVKCPPGTSRVGGKSPQTGVPRDKEEWYLSTTESAPETLHFQKFLFVFTRKGLSQSGGRNSSSTSDGTPPPAKYSETRSDVKGDLRPAPWNR